MLVGVSIEKSVTFRGGLQPFANVYYYEAPLPETDGPGWNVLVDNLVTIEKAIHGTPVNFVRGRLWRADGTQAQNVMIVDKALNGTGALGAATALDRERAVLIQIAAGTDSRGRPVKLRKWFHINAGVISGAAVDNAQLTQTATLTTAQRAAMAAVGEDIKEVAVGVGGSAVATLTAKSGRDVTGAASCHPYLEHHQLGDAWRSV